jgi:hypothetical protein
LVRVSGHENATISLQDKPQNQNPWKQQI